MDKQNQNKEDQKPKPPASNPRTECPSNCNLLHFLPQSRQVGRPPTHDPVRISDSVKHWCIFFNEVTHPQTSSKPQTPKLCCKIKARRSAAPGGGNLGTVLERTDQAAAGTRPQVLSTGKGPTSPRQKMRLDISSAWLAH